MPKRFSKALNWLTRRLTSPHKTGGDRGSILLTSALLLSVFIGSIGLGVDVANWYDSRLRLQTSADAAVRSAMLAKLQGATTNGALVAAARMQAERNGYDSSLGTITIYAPPRPADFADGDGVEVVLTHSVERQFTRIFRDDDIFLEAIAIAVPISSAPPCILAMNASESATVSVSGSSSLTAIGCEIASNSTNPNAVSVQGSASLAAKCVSSAGAIPTASGMTLECGAPHEYASAIADPFQAKPFPAASGPCLATSKLQGKKGIPAVGLPGRYCGGLSIQGLAVLAPGPYVIDGGTLSINGGASVTGLGVTFLLTNGAKVVVNGGADVNLQASTTEPYAGMLFYADPANGMVSHNISGGTNAVFDGALYFPNQEVAFSGSTDMAGVCTVIIADAVEITGNAGLSTDCEHVNLPTAGAVTSVRLVR